MPRATNSEQVYCGPNVHGCPAFWLRRQSPLFGLELLKKLSIEQKKPTPDETFQVLFYFSSKLEGRKFHL
jgi:hypothetical protein